MAGEDAYVTLLLNDAYLPGALVLANSLRDARTTKRLAVLYTPDTVSREVIEELKCVYDYGIPVERIQNQHPANLHLMNRPDLHSAFTKVNLWKLTEFSKVVYLDADVLALRAPDELFDLPYAFSAAPDIGWPDIFNTGVMVLTPNMGDYYALMAMTERGVSFDGADQGLLNMYFKNDFNRLSFTYNVTPSAHYQYLPAYKHFQSSINMVHFIGQNKPWVAGRQENRGETPYDHMVSRWWAVYDKHYMVPSSTSMPTPAWQTIKSNMQQRHAQKTTPELLQYFVNGEFKPTSEHRQDGPSYGSYHHIPSPIPSVQQPVQPLSQLQYHWEPQDASLDGKDSSDRPTEARSHDHRPFPSPQDRQHTVTRGQGSGQTGGRDHLYSTKLHAVHPPEGTSTEVREEQVSAHHQRPQPDPEKRELTPPLPIPTWDAQKQPPPAGSRPEAENFPQQHYEMSEDIQPFVPPERYPSPPRNMWYEVPKEPPAPSTEKPRAIFPWESHRPATTRVFWDNGLETGKGGGAPAGEILGFPESQHAELSTTGSPATVEAKSAPLTPVTPTDMWASFNRSNAWDEDPKIQRYARKLEEMTQPQRVRLARLGRVGPGQVAGESPQGYRSVRVTDFPSESERPSLPVTPAPMRSHLKAWGSGLDVKDLPAASGVPSQADWDPFTQLQQLTKEQPDALVHKLGGLLMAVETTRPKKQAGSSSEVTSQQLSATVLSPQPAKGAAAARIARDMLNRSGRESPVTGSSQTEALMSLEYDIPAPSYTGPGSAWERDEVISVGLSSMPPTEEEQDILQT